MSNGKKFLTLAWEFAGKGPSSWPFVMVRGEKEGEGIMKKLILLRKVGLPVFDRMSKAESFLSFGLKLQDNSQQTKVLGV